MSNTTQTKTATECAHCAHLARMAKFAPMYARAMVAHAAAGHPKVAK